MAQAAPNGQRNAFLGWHQIADTFMGLDSRKLPILLENAELPVKSITSKKILNSETFTRNFKKIGSSKWQKVAEKER
jgi:hypothetical protein